MGKFETLCNEYRENKRLIEELEAENDSLKAAIIEIMGGRETVTEGAAKATVKTVNSTRFDSRSNIPIYLEPLARLRNTSVSPLYDGRRKGLFVILCILVFPVMLIGEILKRNK